MIWSSIPCHLYCCHCSPIQSILRIDRCVIPTFILTRPNVLSQELRDAIPVRPDHPTESEEHGPTLEGLLARSEQLTACAERICDELRALTADIRKMKKNGYK